MKTESELSKLQNAIAECGLNEQHAIRNGLSEETVRAWSDARKIAENALISFAKAH